VQSAFGLAAGAGGVDEQYWGVVGGRGQRDVARRGAGDQVVLGDDRQGSMPQRLGGGCAGGVEHQECWLALVQHGLQLCNCQPEVQRHENRPQPGASKKGCELEFVVQAQPSHPGAGLC
jgi:hypothetical protein